MKEGRDNSEASSSRKTNP
jgi:RNA-binding protein YlmH